MYRHTNCTLEDFQEIVQLFVDDAGGHLKSARIDYGIINRLFLNGGCENENELMLRLNTHTKQLVIARIAFIHQRQGYATRLIEMLNDYGKNNGYTTLIVESVLTKEMKSFLSKHGFQLVSDFEYEMNWKRIIS